MQIGILQTGESPDALRADMGDYPDFFETLLAGQGPDLPALGRVCGTTFQRTCMTATAG